MQIDPGTYYLVKLMRVCEVGPVRHRPLNEIRMKGTVVQKILDAYGEEAFDRCDPE
ncbi:hypothetical protein [Amorphus sp. MBR-141]